MRELRNRGMAAGTSGFIALVLSIPALAVVGVAVPVVLRGPQPVPAAAKARPAPPRLAKTTLRAMPVAVGDDAAPPASTASALPVPAGPTLAASLAVGGGPYGTLALAGGTFLASLGSATFAQLDVLGGGVGRGGLAAGAMQVFFRDPRLGAVGAYIGGSSRPGLDTFRTGVAGALGVGLLGAEILLGYEDVGGRRSFFDMADLVYRPNPGLALTLGHRRLDGRDLAAAGVRADLADGASIVGEGRVGPGPPGGGPAVAGLVGLRLGFGGGVAAAMPSRLVDDVLVGPARR